MEPRISVGPGKNSRGVRTALGPPERCVQVVGLGSWAQAFTPAAMNAVSALSLSWFSVLILELSALPLGTAAPELQGADWLSKVTPAITDRESLISA